MKKKVLILGSGGREHALAWAFAMDDNVSEVYCAPGNGGTAEIAENIKVNLVNLQEVLRLAQEKNIDLTIVGPENPLASGIVDLFRKEGMRIFGPDKYGAQLESSKLFARNLMAEKNISQPSFYSCNTREEVESLKGILELPLVLKADGLAAGKGVIVCETDDEFEQALKTIFDDGKFGDAARRISLERCLVGEELSVFAVCDGENFKILNTAQDHKRAFDDDKGPNTGGMGAYSPAPVVTPEIHDRIMQQVIEPTLRGMASDGKPYTGFLYAGLMITRDGTPKVLEYNCRMGDPETQPIMMRLDSDLVDLCEAALDENLENTTARWNPQPALGVVLAAGGYPANYRKGDVIEGLALPYAEGSRIFHAGTAHDEGSVVTAGGRVLCACALGQNIEQAQANAYALAHSINWPDVYYRKDIGYRAIGRG